MPWLLVIPTCTEHAILFAKQWYQSNKTTFITEKLRYQHYQNKTQEIIFTTDVTMIISVINKSFKNFKRFLVMVYIFNNLRFVLNPYDVVYLHAVSGFNK